MRFLTVATLIALVLTGCDGISEPDYEVDILPNFSEESVLFSEFSGFCFLPPLVKHPQIGTENFDSTLLSLLVVEIFELNAQGKVISTVAHFTGESVSGSESIRVDLVAEHYIVKWHSPKLDPGNSAIYRICVMKGSTELGHIDVISTGSYKGKSSSPLQGIRIGSGQTIPIKFFVEESPLIVPSGYLFGILKGNPATLISIEPTTGQHQQVLSLPFLSASNFATAYDPNDQKYYVSAWDGSSRRLAQIDLRTSQVQLAQVPWSLGAPWTLEFNSLTNRLFGTVKSSSGLLVVDIDPADGTMQVLMQTPFISVTNFAAAFNPEAQHYFISTWDGTRRSLAQIDLTSNTVSIVLENWSLGVPWTLHFNPSTGKLVGTMKSSTGLKVVEINPSGSTMQELLQTPFISVTNFAAALDFETQRYFISAWDGTQRILANINLPSGPILIGTASWPAPWTLEFLVE